MAVAQALRQRSTLMAIVSAVHSLIGNQLRTMPLITERVLGSP